MTTSYNMVDAALRTERAAGTLWSVASALDLHIGEYKMSARQADFGGWKLCDGRELRRADYPHLYDIIGAAFGPSSDPSTLFKLPDARGRAMGFVGESVGPGMTAWALGDAPGEETHAIRVAELPAHSHVGTTGDAGAHTHSTNATGGQGALGLVKADGGGTATESDATDGELNVMTTPAALVVSSAGVHNHSFVTSSVGSGEAMSLMQPTVYGASLFIFSGIL